MNLLQDEWVPVKFKEHKRISLADILCSEDCGTVFLPRDDLQFAAVQMCICLVQSIFTPNDRKELRARHKHPMSCEEYSKISDQFADMFSVESEETPFMQDIRTKENKTGIQKLLVGLPGGDSDTMFVPPNEITKICPSCAAIALFSMASGAPSFGGGFKAPLRGSAPISVLIHDDNLRRMIWKNVIPKDSNWYSFLKDAENLPVWIIPIEEGATVSVSNIGVIRGLFWQPASVFLKWKEENGICDCCGLNSDTFCREFDKQKFRYELSGQWRHPHSSIKISKEKKSYIPSFREETPAWEQLSEIFPKNVGEVPPAVIQNSKIFTDEENLQDLKQKITLSIGGYINNQASILERHHYLVPLSSSLLSDEGIKTLRLLLDTAMEVKGCLKSSVMSFFKGLGFNLKDKKNSSFTREAEKMFFLQSENLIRESLSSYDDSTLLRMASDLEDICKSVLEETATPWLSNLLGEKALLSAKNVLIRHINKIKLEFNNGGKDGSVK